MAPRKKDDDWGGYGSKQAYYDAIKSGKVKMETMAGGNLKSLLVSAATRFATPARNVTEAVERILPKVVRGVSDVAKNEQRVLSNMQRQISGKDLRKIQGLKQDDKGEILMQRYQNYYDDAISPQTGIKMQREAVSDVMKSTTGKLRVVKKARGGGKNKR